MFTAITAFGYLSNRAARMKKAFCFYVGLMRQLFGFKSSQVFSHTVDMYAGAPLLPISGNSKQSALVVFSGYLNVLHICSLRNIPKVGYPIVASAAIYVIKLAARPASMHVKPSKPVRLIDHAIYANTNVTKTGKFFTGRFTNFDTVRAIRGFQPPPENACFGVVVKQFAQAVCAKIVSSHEALQMRIGQKPSSVSALSGLRYFS